MVRKGPTTESSSQVSFRSDSEKTGLLIDTSLGSDAGNYAWGPIQDLVEVAIQHPEVSDDPKPTALFLDFGESSLDFQLRAWTVSDQFQRVSSELRVAVTRALKQAGIEIPFPQRDLHLRSIDEGVSLPAVRAAQEEES